jgi:fatty acid desaturase
MAAPVNPARDRLLDTMRPALAAAGVFQPATRYYLVLGAGLGTLYLCAYGVLLGGPGPALRLAALLTTVFTSVQVALFAHDAAHGAMTDRRWGRQLVGQLGMSFANGYSFAYFVATHLAHHAHPNDPTRDPDMRPEVFSVYAPWPPGRRGLGRIVRRFQARLLPGGLLLWVWTLRANGLVHVRCHWPETRADVVAIVLHGVVWLVVPIGVLGPGPALVNYALVSCAMGVYLGALFIPNHVGMPIVPHETAPGYAHRQTMTSRNFGGSILVAFLVGGLDSQIEHHLLPHVPNVRLLRARPVVRAFCARRGLPYHEMGYVALWRDVLAQFERVGRTAGVAFGPRS